MPESIGRDHVAIGGLTADRLPDLEAQGVDVSLLFAQLRLSPTARIESMLRLRELCSLLIAAGEQGDLSGSLNPPSRERAV